MTKAQRRMLQLGLIPVLALILGGAAVTVSMIRGKLDYDYSTTYDKAIDGITITANMQVEVAPSRDGKVHVTLIGTYTDHQPTIDVRNLEPRAHELQVGAQCAGSGCRLALEIALPSSTRVSISTEGASVELLRLTGNLQVTADDGSVNGVRLGGVRASIKTQSGSVDLGYDRAPANIEVTTDNGSVHLLVPKSAAYAIDAAADHGSTELNVDNDLSSPNQFHLRSSNGSITVDSK
ncbi:DUF4097 family beta strand repeat protein [Kribbella qitaiheensis]|uniref:DUF4097 family beta strand repeat protein n=1 Tax=Kribbella qitaiheensis TaxID=1544730 RepID=A0A7G6WYJ8_9ACTN|nr:DUF4097 family beta strand repeat-containing protein [Kribbella qitaiheensis]QNE19063.1 DUF4097 family beta strand repeat protein [Kribbella qitaiheensis]